MTSLRSQLEAADERYQKAKDEIFISKEKSTQAEEEIKDLKNKIKDLKKEMSSLEGDLESSQKRIESLSNRLEEVQNETEVNKTARLALEEKGQCEEETLIKLDKELHEILEKNKEVELRYQHISLGIEYLEG